MLNIIHLIAHGKNTLVYLSPEKTFYCLGVLLYGENVSIVENRVKNCGFLFRSRSESVSVCRQRGQRGPRN